MSGESAGDGVFHAVLAGQPKQNAAPIPRVRVGVTNTRNVLVGAQVPSTHHADGNQHVHGTYARGDTGHTAGIHHHFDGIPVRDENIGYHTDGLIPAILRGIPKILGEPPGASGAQLSGEFRHDPPPNPHESQLAISSAA